MVFTVAAVEVAKTINVSYTITLSTCPIYGSFRVRPTVLASNFCTTTKFLITLSLLSKICDAETGSKNRGSEAHINWTCCGQAKYGL